MRWSAIHLCLLFTLFAVALFSCDKTNDSDSDGIPDVVEIELGYDPADADMDDDGILDGFEDWNRNGQLDASEANPRDPDTDDDGICDGPRRDNEGNGVEPADSCTFPRVWYVAPFRASGAGQDGSSWSSAFATPQQAVDAASAGDHIWVAAGSYFPASVSAPVLSMKDGLTVIGGFRGLEHGVWQRPVPIAVSTLNGDFRRNDALEMFSDNSNPVVHFDRVSNAALEGFTIVGGNGRLNSANKKYGGGGIDMRSSEDIVLAELVLTGNLSNEDGGAIRAEYSSVRMRNISASGNEVRLLGGAIAIVESEASIEGCNLTENKADAGGAMWLTQSATEIVDCTLASNQAIWGGALEIDFGLTSILQSQLNENLAGFGGAIDLTFGDLYLRDTILVENTGAGWGGAIYNMGTINGVNLLIARNTKSVNATDPISGGGIFNDGDLQLTHATIAFNSPSGIYHEGDSLDIGNSVIWGNGLPGSDVSDCNPLSAFCPPEGRSIQYTCSSDDLDQIFDEGDGPEMGIVQHSVVVSMDPFEPDDGSDLLYLNPAVSDTSCINAGSNDLADATLGAEAWRVQSTRIDGQSETEVDGAGAEMVDLGVHY